MKHTFQNLPLNNQTNNNTHHDHDKCEQLSPKDLKLANVKEDHINTILVLKYDMLHEVIKNNELRDEN